MIIKKETKHGVDILYVKKDISDDKLTKFIHKKLRRNQIKTIITKDTDVYTEEGKLLLIFRKNILSKKAIDDFYDNIIDFANNETSNRGTASGSSINRLNPKIKSNIFGYFDNLSPMQKYILKQKNISLKLNVRECRFNRDFPDRYKKTLPLIKEIDKNYKKYTPDHYRLQKIKADATPFKIPGTSFTTVTTNINFQTHCHMDNGDDMDGFGNLCVIEKGRYDGGETCFPQYSLGVDCRTGDLLFMNVHQLHANLPIVLKDKDAVRLSVVCYLRVEIWKKTQDITKEQALEHNKALKRYLNK
jgi:hypothetical protein